MKRSPIAIILGTRPEVVKLAPIILEMQKSRTLHPFVINTAQQREMVEQALKGFAIRPEVSLDVMSRGQTLSGLSSKLILRLGKMFARHSFLAALVQGDTSTALMGGLAAFYHRVPVGHVEAGLRSGDKYSPFPEEMNRRLLSQIATWHFAPTRASVQNLIKEGLDPWKVYLTGNPVVDALVQKGNNKGMRDARNWLAGIAKKAPLLLVTCHRRENFGTPMRNVAMGIAAIARENPNVKILFPVHMNPKVRDVMIPALKGIPNIHLCPPLDYSTFLCCLRRSYFVLSDSGGVQEEATAMGKPVLVLRRETERREGVVSGALRLVGTSAEQIFKESQRLLHHRKVYLNMARSSNVYGDGYAAPRIIKVLERYRKNQ